MSEASGSLSEESGMKRTREAAAMVTVTDEEVEEFCAILRRMRRPVKYFGGSEKRWRPSFVAEDFNRADAGEDEKEKEKDGGGRRLDLNADPLTE